MEDHSITRSSEKTANQPENSTPSEVEDSNSKAQKTLSIDNASIHTDEYDKAYIMGFVHNPTNSSVNEIRILVNIFNDNGEILESKRTSTFLSNLFTGQSSPFSTIIETNPNEISGFKCSLEGFQVSEIETINVQILRESLTEGIDENVYLAGEIYNHHSKPIIIETVAAGLFNKEGYLLSSSKASKFIHYLDPGEVGPFQVTLPKYHSQDSIATNFQTYIEAQVSTPKPYFNLDMSNISTLHDEDTGIFHLAGEIINAANQSLTVSLMAGIYDEQGFLIDVSITSLPFPIFSRETLPFSFTNWQVLNSDNRYQESAMNYSIQWDPQLTMPILNEYVHLKTINDQIINNLSNIVLTGSIHNDTKNPVRDIAIIGVIYDPESGLIRSVNVQEIASILHNNQSADYYMVIDAYDVPSQIDDNVVITAKGKVISQQQ